MGKVHEALERKLAAHFIRGHKNVNPESVHGAVGGSVMPGVPVDRDSFLRQLRNRVSDRFLCIGFLPVRSNLVENIDVECYFSI
ncbi:MAG: hypothetical protein ACI9R3_004530 [Verrucomicrobiales bacterium]